MNTTTEGRLLHQGVYLLQMTRTPLALSVLRTRQFRTPAYVNGCRDGVLIEACAGLLDGDDPAACIRREAEEDTGFRVRAPRQVLEAYMSPGSVTERSAAREIVD